MILVISDSNPLKGIGNLTIHASNEDDPYVTLKDDVRLLFLHGFALHVFKAELDCCVAVLSNECKMIIYEPPHGKTNNLHMRKQRRRSASR